MDTIESIDNEICVLMVKLEASVARLKEAKKVAARNKVEAALKKWCDLNIAPGMTYGSKKGERNVMKKDKWGNVLTTHGFNLDELVYQMNTASSAMHSYNDIYKIGDKYIVLTDSGHSMYQGDDSHGCNNDNIYIYKYDTLIELVENLAITGKFENNECGDLITLIRVKLNMKQMDNRDHYEYPIHHQPDRYEEIAKIIEEYGSRPYNK